MRTLALLSVVLIGCASPTHQASNNALCYRLHFWNAQAASEAAQELQRRGYVCADAVTMREQQNRELGAAAALLARPSPTYVPPPPAPATCRSQNVNGTYVTVCQ